MEGKNSACEKFFWCMLAHSIWLRAASAVTRRVQGVKAAFSAAAELPRPTGPKIPQTEIAGRGNQIKYINKNGVTGVGIVIIYPDLLI